MTIQQLRRGAEIFEKYMKSEESIGGAEHDAIFFGHSRLDITPEDRAELEHLGYSVDKETDYWRHYA
jgi:hypothetical protein